MRWPRLLRCRYLKMHSEREGVYALRCTLSRFSSGHVHYLSVRDRDAVLIWQRPREGVE